MSRNVSTAVLIALLGLLSRSTAYAVASTTDQHRYYAAYRELDVVYIEIAKSGVGELVQAYVSPGSTEIHRRTLTIRKSYSKGSTEHFDVTQNGGVCPSLSLQPVEGRPLATAAMGSLTQLFSIVTYAVVKANLAQLQHAADLQKGFEAYAAHGLVRPEGFPPTC